MENEKIGIEDINYAKRTLMNYYHLIDKEKEERKEAMILDMKIEDEKNINGISYDGQSGNGCSVTYPSSSYIQQLTLERIGHDDEANKILKMHKALDKHNRIKERISKLSNDQQVLLYAVYRKNKSYTDIAKELYVSKDGTVPSKQSVAERVNDTILAFLER